MDAKGSAASGQNGRNHVAHWLGVAIVDHDPSTLLREGECNRPANTAPAARDNRDLTLEQHVPLAPELELATDPVQELAALRSHQNRILGLQATVAKLVIRRLDLENHARFDWR